MPVPGFVLQDRLVPRNTGGGAVTSVNGLTGAVVLPTYTLGAFASLPGSGVTVGDQYQSTDGPYRFVWTGSVWQAFYNNHAVGVPGPSSGWTHVNFGTNVTLSDAAGVIGIQIADNAALNWRIITKAVTATPYHRETFIRSSLLAANSTIAGYYFYDGTKLMGVECLAQVTSQFSLRVQKITNVTTAGATPFTTSTAFIGGIEYGGIWIRLGNNGTNLTFDWALERGDWQNLFTEAVGTFITPTQYGVGGICTTGTAPNGVRIQFLADTLTA